MIYHRIINRSCIPPTSIVSLLWLLLASAMLVTLFALATCPSNCPDQDRDGVCDESDNCLDLANPDQSDRDGDSLGDLCDPCPDDTSVTPWPDGRPNYVVAMFGGDSTTSRWSIIRNLAFSIGCGGAGSVSSVSWAWSQASFSGDASDNKVATGYTTAGGTYTGTVRTPRGFQPGSAGTALHGSYDFDETGNLVITWSSGKNETWRLSRPKPYPYTMITCIGSNYNVRRAWGFGSQAPLDNVGASVAEIRATGNLTFQDQWYNAYDTADAQSLTYLALANTMICSANAIMGQEPQPLVCDRWHTYIAGNPQQDGRKNFWNHQLGSVGCYEAGHPCPDSTCDQYVIGWGGGHTVAMFQVLDDDGVFRGFVAAEASLHGRYTGGAIVGASYWMQP
jgi:hypothetical protein